MNNFDAAFKAKIEELYAESKVKQQYLWQNELDDSDKGIIEQIQNREYMIGCLEELRKYITREINKIKCEQVELALQMSDGMRGTLGVDVSITDKRVVEIRRNKERVKEMISSGIDNTINDSLLQLSESLKVVHEIKEIKRENTAGNAEA